MCLILIAWQKHPEYPCVIAANRDEFHGRPTEALHWWPDKHAVLAGRDLAAGGTWLGITRDGRFAGLTNYRSSRHARTDAPSRGLLVARWLESQGSVEDELGYLHRVGVAYNGFSVLFCDGERLGVYESVVDRGRQLGPGIYGLSNHLLDTPWPKVEQAKARLQAALDDGFDPTMVLELLRDDRPACDDELPSTGVSLERERILSSAFIRGSGYGTRCSTVIRINREGTACCDEWSWDASGAAAGRVCLQFECGIAA